MPCLLLVGATACGEEVITPADADLPSPGADARAPGPDAGEAPLDAAAADAAAGPAPERGGREKPARQAAAARP